jgi:hypothetical protein
MVIHDCATFLMWDRLPAGLWTGKMLQDAGPTQAKAPLDRE